MVHRVQNLAAQFMLLQQSGAAARPRYTPAKRPITCDLFVKRILGARIGEIKPLCPSGKPVQAGWA